MFISVFFRELFLLSRRKTMHIVNISGFVIRSFCPSLEPIYTFIVRCTRIVFSHALLCLQHLLCCVACEIHNNAPAPMRRCLGSLHRIIEVFSLGILDHEMQLKIQIQILGN